MPEHSTGRIIVLTGGVRSGKSRRALELGSAFDPKIFIATAGASDDEISDDEMRERIAAHRAERGPSWTTIEEPLDVAPILRAHERGAIVIDCMTLWLANAMAMTAAIDIDGSLDAILLAARERTGVTIVVTNEVGWGIVPPYESGRRFRDLAGAMNQRLAAAADEVLLMVAGLSLRLSAPRS